MPASPMTSSTRYFRPGVTQVSYVPTIATQSAPTRAELNAGTALGGEISAIEGWQVTSNFLDSPDLASTFISKVASSTAADDSSLTFYASVNSIDVRSLLPRGTTGYIVFLDESDTAGRKMDVFKIIVAAAPKQRDLDSLAQIQVQFSVVAAPSENVTIPA
jgi:hypothetical protein